MERAREPPGRRGRETCRADESEEFGHVEMLLLARLAYYGSWRLGRESQALYDERRVAQKMRLVDEMGERLARFQPLAVSKPERDPIEDGDRHRQSLWK